MKTALLLIDLQNDFMPTGTLPVPEADAVIPLVNQLQQQFDFVIATQDWHPKNHQSFAANHTNKKVFEVVDVKGMEQILWPEHCVQNTRGAELVVGLDVTKVDKFIQKGTDWEIDSYSAFFDNGHLKKTALDEYLKQCQVAEVYLCGVATEFCVKYTALDAVELGYKTHVIQPACRGMDQAPQALVEMAKAGVKLISHINNARG